MAKNNNAERKAVVSTKHLWGLMEELRGCLAIGEFVPVIIAIAVIAKVTPDEFTKLYIQPKASQKEYLISLLEKKSQLKKLESLKFLKEKHVSAEVIQAVIYAIQEVTDFSVLADEAIEVLTSYLGFKEHSSEREIVQLIKMLAGDLTKSVVYDACAGLCNLVSSLNCKELQLEEVNQKTINIGSNILILKGIAADYTNSNSLFRTLGVVKADLVVTQPPFAVRFNPGQLDMLSNAAFLQFGRGEKIPATAGDALWIQHTLYNMNDEGRAMMLMPQGWLFRGGYDAKLREYLLDHDLIEAIIGLPAGLLNATAIPTILLVLNKNKPDDRRGVIHFVDASNMGKHTGKRKKLSENDIELIVSLAKGEHANHEYFRSVLLPDIHKNENDLSVKCYIHQLNEITIPRYQEEQDKLKKVQATFSSAQTKLMNLITGASATYNFDKDQIKA